jgi:hypothetical protein
MVSIITDAFFDDICGISYLMSFKDKMTLFPTGLGYTRPQTTDRVCHGLQKWASHVRIAKTDRRPMDPTCYFPFTDTTTLDFGDAMANELGFEKPSHDPKSRHLKGDLLILGPYNVVAHHEHDLDHRHHAYGSFSNLRFSVTDPFPSPITLGTTSNAGIDPCSAMLTWKHFKTLLPVRQPPIQMVLNTIQDVDTWIARKIKKVLEYSLIHNPGGGYVWDLGLALVYKHPDLITRTQLYDAVLDKVVFAPLQTPSPKRGGVIGGTLSPQITLTMTTTSDPEKTQVYLVDVDLTAMMSHLHHDLMKN